MTKLLSELAPVAETKEPGFVSFSFEDVKDLPYLQACIDEALRLHSTSAIGLPRIVPEGGAVVCDEFFPEGMTLSVPVSWRCGRFFPSEGQCRLTAVRAGAGVHRPPRPRSLGQRRRCLSTGAVCRILFAFSRKTCPSTLVAPLQMVRARQGLHERQLYSFQLWSPILCRTKVSPKLLLPSTEQYLTFTHFAASLRWNSS